MRGSTPARPHSRFISAQICRRPSSFPLLVRKIAPEAVFCFWAYWSSFRQSFPGNRMVRILPLREISALPCRAASTVRYRTSLTRMPVAPMASTSRPSRSCPSRCAVSSRRWYSAFVSSRPASRNSRRWTLRNFTRQPPRPRNSSRLFSAESLALMLAGA